MESSECLRAGTPSARRALVGASDRRPPSAEDVRHCVGSSSSAWDPPAHQTAGARQPCLMRGKDATMRTTKFVATRQQPSSRAGRPPSNRSKDPQRKRCFAVNTRRRCRRVCAAHQQTRLSCGASSPAPSMNHVAVDATRSLLAGSQCHQGRVTSPHGSVKKRRRRHRPCEGGRQRVQPRMPRRRCVRPAQPAPWHAAPRAALRTAHPNPAA